MLNCILVYLFCFLATPLIYAQDTDTLRRELTISQTLINNILQFVAFNYSATRTDTTVKSYSLYPSEINPIDTVKYGFITSNPYCDTTSEYSSLASDVFQPCLVADFPNQYAIEVRFKGAYTSGNSLSTNLYKNICYFLRIVLMVNL